MDYEVENTKRTLERLSKNADEKNPRVEFSKSTFQPGKIPYYKRKKIQHDLDKYLILSFTSIILFTIAVLIIFTITGSEPTVLVGCFFGAFGGEVLACARIKKYKLHKEAELKKEDNYGS